MINASNNPFSCEPAVIGLNNQILELGTISRVDDTFSFSTGFKWEINSQIFQNTTTFDYTPATATTGYKRIDIAVLNANNEIEFLAGTESDTIALRPTIPLNNLLLTQWNIDGATIEDSETPLVGSDYVKKSFAQPYSYSESGANKSIPLHPLGYSEVRLTNSSLVSISGFNVDLISGNPNAEVPFLRKKIFVKNLTGNDVVFKNGDSVNADIQLNIKGNTDVIVPNGEVIVFDYDPGGMDEFIRSFTRQVYKTITGNTTIDNSFNGAIVRVKANSTITIEDGLVSDFNCVFRTYSGVTATFTAAGTATIDAESDGTTLNESKMCSLFVDGTDNYILSGTE